MNPATIKKIRKKENWRCRSSTLCDVFSFKKKINPYFFAFFHIIYVTASARDRRRRRRRNWLKLIKEFS